jgi:hypothetical protein
MQMISVGSLSLKRGLSRRHRSNSVSTAHAVCGVAASGVWVTGCCFRAHVQFNTRECAFGSSRFPLRREHSRVLRSMWPLFTLTFRPYVSFEGAF